MSDENIQKQNSIEDTYLDHATHLVYRNDCSECFKKAPQVEINQDGDIVLTDSEEELEQGNIEVDDYDYDKDDANYHEYKDNQ